MSKNFKQYDPRWAKVKYAGSTIAMAGCGATASAELIRRVNPKITPKKTAKWLTNNGYAVKGHGTAWNGITACLKHYGLTDVKQYSSTGDFIKAMKKGALGIICFGKGTKGGVTWTTGGHFVAFTDCKVKDGKTYLYARDPGARDNDGWFCYETQIKGLVKTCYTCRKKEPTSKEKAQTTNTTTKDKTPTEKAKKEPKSVGGYTVGKQYKVMARSGLNCRKKYNVKSDRVCVYKYGSNIVCKDVKKMGSNIWIKTVRGWCAAKYNGNKYLK